MLGNSSQVEEQLTNIASANISMGETGGNKYEFGLIETLVRLMAVNFFLLAAA